MPGQARFAALKAWRAEVARAHNLPAYVIFHDATLAAIAALTPRTLDDLQGISGIGAKKLEAYGADVLRVVGGANRSCHAGLRLPCGLIRTSSTLADVQVDCGSSPQ